MEEVNKIKVILVETMEPPRTIEINDSLASMQEVVGGMIEEYMPYKDDVALICNEEGKMNGMPLNRAIKNENGMLMDIIAGPFFIAYAPIESEKFLSLPDDLEKKYMKKFEKPERFIHTDFGIKPVAMFTERDTFER